MMYAPEGYPACPFCGSEIAAGHSETMHELHVALEVLANEPSGSDAFEEALATVKEKIGG